MNKTRRYKEYKAKMQKIADVKYASAVLQWDQETYLPPMGAEIRGRQIATLSEIAHAMSTGKAMGKLLTGLNTAGLPREEESTNVFLSLEDYERSKKLSKKYVRELSETVAKSYHAWIKARKENDFRVFEPLLDHIVTLKREEAEMTGYTEHPYNALMSEYDKGLSVAITDKVFAGLRPKLQTLLNKIRNKPQVDDSFLHQFFDKDLQWEWGMQMLRKIGFDFQAGRQDTSVHPFTTNFNSYDVRVTTRIDEGNFGNMTWSCLHEGGHALYEQGLPADMYGLPLGEYCSLSIHESQSRLWENCIGRGLAFWQHNFSGLKTFFPKQFEKVSAEDFYFGINKVCPSLIRTEADELTYHFHVMIRYEIEKMLIGGEIKTKDIPAYWNEHYQKYLGITVPDDINGCLQDIHWSHGSFGYFATYSLGSLYAAQLWNSIKKDHPETEINISRGDNSSVLKWLRTHIHSYGKKHTSEVLCKSATGEFLKSEYFINYAENKYNNIYDL